MKKNSRERNTLGKMMVSNRNMKSTQKSIPNIIKSIKKQTKALANMER